MECFQDISRALTPTGVVAINFAGNTSSVASRLVFSTILSSFHHCRAFEDGAHTTDYRNFVFFCSRTSPVVFRKPVPADYLLFPSPLMREKVLGECEQAEMDLGGIESGRVVHNGDEEELEEAQRAGVRQHWELMNGVLPLETWAMYSSATKSDGSLISKTSSLNTLVLQRACTRLERTELVIAETADQSECDKTVRVHVGGFQSGRGLNGVFTDILLNLPEG
jgi:hypothetical protein